MYATMIIFGAVIFVFIILGFIFRKGKGTSLIAGYNTMSEAEKEKINERALTKTLGNVMFLFAILMIICLVSIIIKKDWLLNVSIVLFVIILFGSIIYINQSERFKK